MLGKLHLLLATACVVALIAEGHADCPYADWGPKTEFAKHFGPLVIDPKKSEVDVKIPYEELVGCHLVGASAVTCDSDYDTNLLFVEELTVHVSRRHTSYAGTLYATVYCRPFVPPTIKVAHSWQQGPRSIASPLHGTCRK